MSAEQTRAWILSIDQGTTNTKALLVGHDGRAAFRASVPVTTTSPRPAWTEQNATELWQSVLAASKECVAWAAARGTSIAGVAICNQRETVIAWERATSAPLAPAILWQCRRSSELCEELRSQGCEPFLRERTGLGIDPLFSASKMRWMLDNVTGLRARAEAGEICFGTVDSWLISKFSGGAVHACDVSNASRTQLLNLHTADWDNALLELFGLPRIALPQVLLSSAKFGVCADIEGLAGVPIVSAMGDSHAAMVGHASFQPGTVKATYGTGSSLMTLLPHASVAVSSSQVATTVAWGIEGAGDKCIQYALEGNISMAGAAVQWVGEFLGLASPAHDAAALAATVSDHGGVYFVPAMAGLAAPYWDTEARGMIAGLTSRSRAAHLARAAVEAIAFQVKDVFDAMEAEAGCALPSLFADGGATRNDWLMQFQADVLGRPVVRSSCEDLSALGAAWFGGLTLGWWPSTSAFESVQPETQTFVPCMDEDERRRRCSEWSLAVARARLAEAQR